MANQWFKFYGGEYLSDPKIERLTPAERSCWITLLAMASMEDIGRIEFLTIESLLNKSGIQLDPYHPEEWERGLGVLQKFKNLRMIEDEEDGTIIIKNWTKRQETSLTNAERQARFREKRQSNEKVTGQVTSVTVEEKRREENRREREGKEILIIPSKELVDEMTSKYNCSPTQVRNKCDAILNYCKSQDKTYKDYKAVLRTWLNKDFGLKKIDPLLLNPQK